MIKMKVLPDNLDELKFNFLELSDTQSIDVSVQELKLIVRKCINNSAEVFAEKFAESLIGDDGSDRVPFDKLQKLVDVYNYYIASVFDVDGNPSNDVINPITGH